MQCILHAGRTAMKDFCRECLGILSNPTLASSFGGSQKQKQSRKQKFETKSLWQWYMNRRRQTAATLAHGPTPHARLMMLPRVSPTSICMARTDSTWYASSGWWPSHARANSEASYLCGMERMYIHIYMHICSTMEAAAAAVKGRCEQQHCSAHWLRIYER
jgi:hypothetical protein